MSNFTVAGKGLRKMFLGQIVAIIGAVVALIPALGIVDPIADIAGSILILVGLYSARGAHINYEYAFYMAIAGIVMNALSMIFAKVEISFVQNFLGGLASVGSTAVGFFGLYFICTGSSELLNAKGDGYQADRATLIWKINAVCALVSIAAILVSRIPVINVIASVALLVAAIAEIVACVLYVIFLYKGSQSLLS